MTITQARRVLADSGEIALYGAANLVRPALGILTLPLFTALFGPSDYGIIGIYTALLGLLTIILPVNGQIYLLWNRARLGPEGSAVAAGSAISMAAAIGGACALAATVYWWVAPPGEIPLWVGYLAIATAWLSAVILIDTHVHQADQQAVPYFGINLAWALIGPVATVVLAAALASDWTARVWGITIAAGVTAAWSLVSLRRRGALAWGWNMSSVRALLRFGLPLLPHTLGLWATAFLDRFIVAGAAGMISAGIYTVAVSIALGIGAIHDGVSRFFAPRLAQWTADPSGAGLRKGTRFFYGYAAIAIVTIPFVTIATNWLVSWVLPDEYGVVKDFLFWLVATQALIGISRMCTGYLYAAGRTGTQSVVTVASAAVGLVLAVIGVAAYGAIGAAYASLATAVVQVTMAYIAARRTGLLAR
jgi:O-antigen/teichoic acid export membrane protein